MERRKPLDRGKPIERKTGLAPGKPLERGGELRRTAALPRPRPPGDTPTASRREPRPTSVPKARKPARRTGPTTAVIDVVRARDAQCVIGVACAGRAVEVAGLVPHHRRNRAMGGSTAADTNQPQNLLAVCRPDNSLMEDGEKTGDLDRYRDNGWKVHQGVDPAAVPVLYPDGRWYRLDESGGRHVTTPPGG